MLGACVLLVILPLLALPLLHFYQVRRMQFGKGGIPYISTHDGRTLRYPDPDIKEQDTVMLDLETGKIKDFIKVGCWCRLQA